MIECSEFQLANNKTWKIETNITCHSRNVIDYLKCKFCLYETYIGKTIGDPVHGFKGRMNNHISEIKKGISTCKFPIHVFNCSKRYNKQLEEPYFTIHVMLSLKNNSRLESLETLFHNRGYDTLNRPTRKDD